MRVKVSCGRLHLYEIFYEWLWNELQASCGRQYPQNDHEKWRLGRRGPFKLVFKILMFTAIAAVRAFNFMLVTSKKLAV